MPDAEPRRAWTVLVAREWWVVALAMAIAAAVAYLVVADRASAPQYEARAVLAIDSVTAARYPGLPSPDQLVSALSADRFLDGASKLASVTPDEITSSMSVYTLGAPPSQLVVSFETTDSDRARSVVETLAAHVVDYARTLGTAPIGEQQERVRETEDALESIEDLVRAARRSSDVSLRLLAEQTRWQMRMRLREDLALLRELEGTYAWNGAITVGRISLARSLAAPLGGAALLGLVAGVAVAALREAALRRR